MPLQQLVAYLDALPDEKEREYEVSLTKKATEYLHPGAQMSLVQVLEGDFSDKVRYNAFYCLNIVHRHNKDFSKQHDLLERYRDEFDVHVTFDHVEALYNIESDSIYDYNDLLKKTNKNARLIDNNAGFVHMFADTFATIYEKGGLHDKQKYVQRWGADALAAVNHAIALDHSYAKYYCTKARILCIMGDFTQAISNVNYAISCENSSRGDYALRIGTYQYYKMLIYTEYRLNETVQKLMRGGVSATPQLQPLYTPLQPADTPPSKQPSPAFELLHYRQDKPYVFISYSHKDQETVYRIMDMLQQQGVRLWCDVRTIPTGINYFEYIAERIDGCCIFMPMLSSNAIASEFVRKEIIEAQEQHLPTFPIFLEDLMLSPGIRMMLGGCQRVNWTQNTPEQSIQMILRDLPPDVFLPV